MNNLVSSLKKIGLSEKESKLYLVALEFGPMSVINLARRSGLKRGTIYEFLEGMIEKGILEVEVVGKRRLYKGVLPQNLHHLVERQQQIVSELVSELDLLISSKSKIRPKIRSFEGRQGILAIYEEILLLPPGAEVLGYASFGGVYDLYSEKEIKSYIGRRVKAGIKQKLIMPTDKYVDKHQNSNTEELREVILVPEEKFPIKNEISIYENKVAIISLGVEKIGVIIESSQTADTQRAIFNLLWDALNK